MEFIDLKSAFKAYENEFLSAIKHQCENAAFIGGAAVSEFEKDLSDYLNTPALSCSDGTNALILALKACEISAGDEVITSPFTFIATAEAIAECGAKVVFADVKADFCLDVAAVKAAITPRTKAICAVSLFGNTRGLEELAELAREHDLLLIEDGAQSFGARTASGRLSCSVADISTTSFFPSKPLGCFGDGGAIFSRNESLLNRARLLANHGSTERYKHEIIGTNSRLDAIQAAILRIKLAHLDAEISRRNELAANYCRKLSAQFVLPRVSGQSAWAQFCVLVHNRDEFCQKLAAEGIPSAIYYPIPLHLQPAFAHLSHARGDFKMAEFLAEHVCALPFSAYLSDADQERIIAVANAAVEGNCSLNQRALVLGAGKMGQNHIRELEKSGFKVDAIDPAKPELVGLSANLIDAPNGTYDLAVVASPSSQHEAAAKIACGAAKCVIVEKPLAPDLAAAARIDERAFVGFNERFNPAFMELKKQLEGALILHASFLRESPRPERIKDADVAEDLASHDLDLAAVLGLDLAELELSQREKDYFCARSKRLEITASWRAASPARRVKVLASKDGAQLELIADLANFSLSKNGQITKLAGFSNLAAMHADVINSSAEAARKADGIRVLQALSRLK